MPSYTNSKGMPVNVSQSEVDRFLAQNPGDVGRIGDAFSNSTGGGSTPAPSSVAAPSMAAPMPVTPSQPAPVTPPYAVSAPAAAGPASMAALNKVVEPDAKAGGGLESGFGMSIGALSAATGGNQENLSASAPMGNMLRGLGRRSPSMEALVLPRKAY